MTRAAHHLNVLLSHVASEEVAIDHGDLTAVIVDGCRTPFAKSFGKLMHYNSIALGVAAVKGLLDKTQLDPRMVDEVIFGNVVLNTSAGNIAREIVFDAALPRSIPAVTVVLQCLTGLECVGQAVSSIEHGDAHCIIAGGSDSTSQAELPLPQKLITAAGKYSMGGGNKHWGGLLTMLSEAGSPLGWIPSKPAIAERVTGHTMGYHADVLAEIWGVPAEEQNEFALRSHTNAYRAVRDGIRQTEIVSMTGNDGSTLATDDLVRSNMSEAALRKLKPCFRKPGDHDPAVTQALGEAGTINPASSSALTDGASAVLVMSRSRAGQLGYPTDIIVRAYAKAAIEPVPALLWAPALAIPKALQKAGLTLDDIDVFEIHEAFAAQVLATLRCLASAEFAKEHLNQDDPVGIVPMEKINPTGGSLAIGHPFAATGGRLVGALASTLRRTRKRFGLISVCAAGGIGGVMILENTDYNKQL